MPATLNCPNCGAAANDGATSCEYCGSGLVAMACRSCFGAMFAGAPFCPQCGAKAAEAVDADQSALRCPGCGGEHGAEARATRHGDEPRPAAVSYTHLTLPTSDLV